MTRTRRRHSLTAPSGRTNPNRKEPGRPFLREGRSGCAYWHPERRSLRNPARCATLLRFGERRLQLSASVRVVSASSAFPAVFSRRPRLQRSPRPRATIYISGTESFFAFALFLLCSKL